MVIYFLSPGGLTLRLQCLKTRRKRRENVFLPTRDSDLLNWKRVLKKSRQNVNSENEAQLR